MVKTIFWDNDGVLVDTERLYYHATRNVMAKIDVELTEELFLEFFLHQGTGAWHLAAERGLSEAAIEALRQERNALYAHLLAQEPLVIEGVEQVIAELHGRYLMGIVTSSRRDHFDIIHRHTGLLRYFEFILASGDYPRSKPHPDPYLAALDRSGCAPDECLVIEDSARGLRAAHAAGIPCIVVPTDFTRSSDFSDARAILNSLADLPGYLARCRVQNVAARE